MPTPCLLCSRCQGCGRQMWHTYLTIYFCRLGQIVGSRTPSACCPSFCFKRDGKQGCKMQTYPTGYTGSRIKLVREHRGLTQQKLGEMLGYGKSSANRIAQYEMGYRSPKANRLKEIAKAMNIREEIFLMPDETPIDLLRILIWYDWEHEGVLQLATSRTANTPPGKTVSPIIYSEQLPLNRLLLDWADQKHSLSVRKITRADYLEWMLQWPPRLP